MTWTIASYLFDTLDAALRREPRALATPPAETATILITLGIRLAEVSKVPGGALGVIAACLPGLQPDEEAAVAAIREAYAALRRVKQRAQAGLS